MSENNEVVSLSTSCGTVNRFSQAILDSFSVNIAVLSRDGIIVAVNKAWSLFADQNSGWDVRSTEIGVDYLQVAGAKIGPYGRHGRAAHGGIQEVLTGSTPEFSLEYPAHTSTKKRWFLLQVIGLLESPNEAAMVSHLDITARKLAEIKREDTAEQFEELANHLHQVFWIKDAVETKALYKFFQNEPNGEGKDFKNSFIVSPAEFGSFGKIWKFGHASLRRPS